MIQKVIMKQPYILQLPARYHHLCFLPGANPAAVQQHQHNGKGNLHQLNHPKTETKRPKCNHKGMVYTRFMKGCCIRRWGGGDTDVYLRGLVVEKAGLNQVFFCCAALVLADTQVTE